VAPTTKQQRCAMANLGEAPRRTGSYVRSIRWGLVVIVASAAIAWYGAYGGTNPQADQEAAVPFIIGVMVVLSVVIFGALVPPGLRGIAAKPGRWAGIGLTLAILGLVAVPVSSWSGLPVALGTAAAVLGAAGRQVATRSGQTRALPSWGFGIGVAAIALSVVMLVIGNTVLSQ